MRGEGGGSGSLPHFIAPYKTCVQIFPRLILEIVEK